MATTLTALVNDVYTITKRPDLVAETTLAVKVATLKLHQADYFYRDLLETGVAFDSMSYTQQFDVKSLFPRWRAWKYVREFSYSENSSGAPGVLFTFKDPTAVIDAYKVDKNNIAYMAGSTLNLRCYRQFQYLLVSMYLNPDVTDSGYSSWIADDFPYAVETEAARVVFKQIGFDEQSSAYEKLSAEQFQLVKISNITPEGY